TSTRSGLTSFQGFHLNKLLPPLAFCHGSKTTIRKHNRHLSSNNSFSSMSTHPTTTPELHWPSKCRWSMESPLQTKSIGMISHEETIAGSDLSSTCPTLSDILSTKDSSETQTMETKWRKAILMRSEVMSPLERSLANRKTKMIGTLQSIDLPLLTTTSPEMPIDSPIATFIPLIGVWLNYLFLYHLQLFQRMQHQVKEKDYPSVVREFPCTPVQKIPVAELKEDETLKFSWAARMDPATKNLYGAAKPIFLFDRTPQIKISSQSTVSSNQFVLQAENSESNFKTYLKNGIEHLQSQLSVELKDLSTPINNLIYFKTTAPTKTIIMEEIPSFVIVLEANLVSTDNFLISLYSPAHGSFHVTQID
ncbi:hypothetical protein HID58_093458, partial [Brassica napus]